MWLMHNKSYKMYYQYHIYNCMIMGVTLYKNIM